MFFRTVMILCMKAPVFPASLLGEDLDNSTLFASLDSCGFGVNIRSL